MYQSEQQQNKYYKTKYLNKEQQELGDLSLPASLYDYETSKKAHQALIQFLKEHDPALFNSINQNDKMLSREYKHARQREYYNQALFFIHHNDRLKKWFSYDRQEENFNKLYCYLKDRGFYVDVFEKGVSGMFRGFGVVKIKI
jgi:hypothetical protein